MASLILGPALGGLVGAAMYYTVSKSIRDGTDGIRDELHTLSNHLTISATSTSSSFQPFLQSSSSSAAPPTTRPHLSDLLKSKWNTTLTSIVHLSLPDLEILGREVKGLSMAAGDVVKNRVFNSVVESTGSVGRVEGDDNLKSSIGEIGFMDKTGTPNPTSFGNENKSLEEGGKGIVGESENGVGGGGKRLV